MKNWISISLIIVVLLGIFNVAVAADVAAPVIDNERVTVWNVDGTLPPAAHAFITLTYPGKGTVTLGHAGDTPGHPGEHNVVIELKDFMLAPLTNQSGYPNAFPRPRVEKILENDKIVVWSYRWNPGEPTPVHFHDKDVVVVYGEDTSLKSSTLDGKSVVNNYKSGEIHFNKRDRVHSELLMNASGSAMMVELK